MKINKIKFLKTPRLVLFAKGPQWKLIFFQTKCSRSSTDEKKETETDGLNAKKDLDIYFASFTLSSWCKVVLSFCHLLSLLIAQLCSKREGK